MKKILFSVVLLSSINLFAQEKATERKIEIGKMAELPQGWTLSSKNAFLINQAAFSNWVAGGTNSLSATLKGDYEANLRKGKNIWDNRLLVGYGIQKNEGTISQKTDDYINLTSKYRRQIKESKWYAGSAFNFKTQFANGYEYDDITTGEGERLTAGFLSPAYALVGVGLDYIPNDNFELNIHPLTSKMTYIRKDKTKVDKDGNLRFGLNSIDDSFVYELGIFVGARQKVNIMKNITLDHQLGLYSNYLENPDHIDVNYLANLNLKVNDYISAQVSAEVLYDHDQLRHIQSRESIGIGLSYNIDNKKEK